MCVLDQIEKLKRELFRVDTAITECRVEVAKSFPLGHPYYEQKILDLNGIACGMEKEIEELETKI